ncbi:hypothetical protein Tco_1150166, partial [Tanacetum coccineum]
DLDGEPITTAQLDVTTTSAPVTTAGVSVSAAGSTVTTANTAEPRTTPTTTTDNPDDEELTLAETLVKMKSSKSKSPVRLRRFCIYYEYVEAEQVQDNAVHGVDEIKAKITEINNDTETMKTEIDPLGIMFSI